MSIYTTPPSWQPDAVPTPHGWKHPHRDELLVSVKLDMSLFEKKDEPKEVHKEVAAVESTPVVETVETQEVPKVEKKTPRKKKNG